MKPTYEELVKALGAAIEVYQYASMTSWEREVTKPLRDEAENAFQAAGGKSPDSLVS